MKKIGLLTTLLVGGLLLTGCNNHQYEEEFSEYGLLQWPNGTITLEDFEKEGNIIKESEVDNWTGGKICSETPETACVPIILKENEILVTPHEYNEFIAEETDLTLLEPYYTDLKTFRKVTGLKEASPEYVEGELPGTYIFDAYTKFYKTKEEREAMLKEKLENQTIDEPVVEEPTYEILEWTGYVGCIGGCEDGSDEEYVEGYYYRYTNPELGLRVTTPSGQLGYYGKYFRDRYDKPIFTQVGNGIYASELKTNLDGNYLDPEFIKVYEKDPNISLEDLLKQKYEDCRMEKLELGLGGIFIGFGDYFYAIESIPGNQEDNCNYREEGEGGAIIFFLESKDGSKYYKVGINDGCAPGPCSIFGKVEVL